MSKKKRRWWLWILGAFAIAALGVLPVVESRDPLAWRRFKRHAGYAIRWGSLDQAILAITPPPSRRVAAVAPYNGKPTLTILPQGASAKSGYSSFVSMGQPLTVQPPGGADPVELEGDIEWEVSMPAGHYIFLLHSPGSLTKAFKLYWNGANDIDLGKLQFISGDLDGDDYVTSKEADYAQSLVGEKVAPYNDEDPMRYRYYSSELSKSLVDIDRDGSVEEWEIEAIAKNAGKRGDARHLKVAWY